MQVVRVWLVVVGISFMVAGAILMSFSAGVGRSFALGVLSAGILVLAGSAIVRVAANALGARPDSGPGNDDLHDFLIAPRDVSQTRGR
ncbi:MAG: hypothetical protein V4510_06250 [bacterium]